MQFGKKKRIETWVGGKLVGTDYEVTVTDKDNLSSAGILTKIMELDQRITNRQSYMVGVKIRADPKSFERRLVELTWTEPEEKNV